MLKSKNKSELTDNVLSKLNIVRDLTADQRKETIVFSEEKRRGIDNGENVAIRNGEVVELPPLQSGAHSFQG